MYACKHGLTYYLDFMCKYVIAYDPLENGHAQDCPSCSLFSWIDDKAYLYRLLEIIIESENFDSSMLGLLISTGKIDVNDNSLSYKSWKPPLLSQLIDRRNHCKIMSGYKKRNANKMYEKRMKSSINDDIVDQLSDKTFTTIDEGTVVNEMSEGHDFNLGHLGISKYSRLIAGSGNENSFTCFEIDDSIRQQRIIDSITEHDWDVFSMQLINTLSILLDFDYNLNICDNNNRSGFSLAVMHNDHESVLAIIKAGINKLNKNEFSKLINTKFPLYHTEGILAAPLHFAIMMKLFPIVRTLLQCSMIDPQQSHYLVPGSAGEETAAGINTTLITVLCGTHENTYYSIKDRIELIKIVEEILSQNANDNSLCYDDANPSLLDLLDPNTKFDIYASLCALSSNLKSKMCELEPNTNTTISATCSVESSIVDPKLRMPLPISPISISGISTQGSYNGIPDASPGGSPKSSPKLKQVNSFSGWFSRNVGSTSSTKQMPKLFVNGLKTKKSVEIKIGEMRNKNNNDDVSDDKFELDEGYQALRKHLVSSKPSRRLRSKIKKGSKTMIHVGGKQKKHKNKHKQKGFSFLANKKKSSQSSKSKIHVSSKILSLPETYDNDHYDILSTQELNDALCAIARLLLILSQDMGAFYKHGISKDVNHGSLNDEYKTPPAVMADKNNKNKNNKDHDNNANTNNSTKNANERRVLYLWDEEQHKIINQDHCAFFRKLHTGKIYSTDFCRSYYLATNGNDGRIIISCVMPRNKDTGNAIKFHDDNVEYDIRRSSVINTNSSWNMVAVFSPRRRYLVFGGLDQVVTLIDFGNPCISKEIAKKLNLRQNIENIMTVEDREKRCEMFYNLRQEVGCMLNDRLEANELNCFKIWTFKSYVSCAQFVNLSTSNQHTEVKEDLVLKTYLVVASGDGTIKVFELEAENTFIEAECNGGRDININNNQITKDDPDDPDGKDIKHIKDIKDNSSQDDHSDDSKEVKEAQDTQEAQNETEEVETPYIRDCCTLKTGKFVVAMGIHEDCNHLWLIFSCDEKVYIRCMKDKLYTSVNDKEDDDYFKYSYTGEIIEIDKNDDDRIVCVIEDATDVVFSISISPNGKLIAIGSDDGCIRVYQLIGNGTCGECVKAELIYCACLDVRQYRKNKDGHRIINTLANINMKRSRQDGYLNTVTNIVFINDRTLAFVFRQCNQYVFIAQCDENDCSYWKEARIRTQHSSKISSACVDLFRQVLVTASWDCTVQGHSLKCLNLFE